MYTKLDDQKKAKEVISFMNNNPNCCIKDILKGCTTTKYRLKDLELNGYIVLPKLTHQDILNRRFKNRISVTIGREYGKWIGY